MQPNSYLEGKMSSGDRFYQLELRHRSAMWGDIGSILKIEGLVVGGCGSQAVLMLPGSVPQNIVRSVNEEQFASPMYFPGNYILDSRKGIKYDL